MTWSPTTEAELLSAIENGTFAESANLEAKRETGSTASERKETARDLASFALYGGSIIIGLAENKEGRTWELAPVILNGLGERIDQIAGISVDPPLHVITRDIPSERDPTMGYLLVEVPPSRQAPHMVDGVYYARGDRTRRRLSDAEVLRLHAARENSDVQTLGLLRQEIERDPIPRERRTTGHMYLVAEPQSTSTEAALGLIADSERQWRIIKDANSLVAPVIRDYAPVPSYASSPVSRSRGAAWTNVPTRRGLPENGREKNLLDIEFRENGGIRVLVGRMSQGDSGELLALDGLVVAYCIRIVAWAKATAAEIGYRGSWSFGIAGNGLAGARSVGLGRGRGSYAYDSDDYTSVTNATNQEITETPWVVVRALAARLTRALGSSQSFSFAFEAPK